MNRGAQVSNASVVHDVPPIVEHEDDSIEVPHFELARDVSKSGKSAHADGGYFQLNHSVFRDPKLRELPGDTFRLYLWLSSQGWRFPDSDGTLRAAISFITDAIGLPHATVSRGLKLLRETGLIQLIETDFKRGNLWRITSRAAWMPLAGNKVPQIEVPQSDLTAPSKRGGSHLKLSKKVPQIEVEIRNTIPFKKLENSLSETPPDAIRNYLESIKPPLKREREKDCYLKLSLVYRSDEIIEALRFIRERGIPGSGDICHSPMAFLARAMNDVQTELQREALTKNNSEEKARQQEITETNERSANLRQQQEWERKERAFLSEFSTQESQEKAVSEWAAQLPWKLSDPKIKKNLAICSWWDSVQRAGVG